MKYLLVMTVGKKHGCLFKNICNQAAIFFFFEKINIQFFLYGESPKNDFIVIIKLSYPSFLNFLINTSVDKIRLMASSFHMIFSNFLKKVRMISYIIQKRFFF